MNERKHHEELPADLALDIQHYLDGQISSEAFARLQQLLEENATARDFYRSYASMDANLREVAEESEPENVVRIPIRRRGVVGALLQAVATFVLGAVAVYFVVDRTGQAGDGRVVDEKAAPKPLPLMMDAGLAILTQAVGVDWSEGARAYPIGSVLPGDTLELDKGLLQIEFFSGAIVIVEGPAKFELIDPMKAVCHFGKTRANVPDSAHGFTIASADMDVVDLGTEFALVVDEDGQGEVHVFDGEVEVYQNPGGEMHNLMSGNGLRIEGGVPEFLPLNEMGFVNAQRVSFLAHAEADRHLARWLEYSEELKAHPDVLLYYSFDEKTTWSRKLRNVRKMTADPLHGAIVGCRWSEGRWIGKGSLEFKGAGDRVRIQIPGEHDEFSLMAWVRIDGFDRDLNSLMLSDNWVPGGVHWQFTRKGELVLGTRLEKESGHFVSSPVLNHTHLGKWIQLAVSYDSKSKRVGHYLDGELVWEGEMAYHIPISVPQGELGNWKTDYPQTGSNIRNLNGRMDEFVVFSRGLSDDEMRHLYDSGKPHS
jgi:anti-sigma factor RsiW